jgi:UDP-N-acetylmuramyl pentapeptide phosphotransferase/UDP-N-acetylglucosamine-1-phosphate transferase
MHAAISTSLLRLCATALCVVVLPTGSACAATIDDGLDGMAMPENAVPLLAQGPARVALEEPQPESELSASVAVVTLLGFALNGVCVLRRERCAHRG